MNNQVLDDWDRQVILYIKKSPNPTISGIKQIWSKRCLIASDDVASVFIFHHFFEIFQKLELTQSKTFLLQEFFNNCAPNKFFLLRSWLGEDKKFEMSDMFLDNLTITNNKYWDIKLAALLQQFIFLRVDELPGFKDYVEKQKSLD